MAKPKYRVKLTDAERQDLRQQLTGGKAASRQLRRARILLKADENGADRWTDNQIMAAFDVSLNTIARVRKTYVEEGLRAAVERKPPERVYARRLDGEAEAHLVALACGPTPAGRGRWTLRLLAARMVELGYVETVSHETVRQVLQKTC